MTRVLRSLLAYVGALVVVAGAAFALVLVLAGPHAGMLPHGLEMVMMLLGWLLVLVIPVLLARKVWRQLGARQTEHSA